VVAGVSHCPTCHAEYVAGPSVCADCGGTLAPGPLREYGLSAASPPPQALGTPDVLLATMPGLQADLIASALTMEGITCLLKCEGIRQLRHPERESPGALAATLPVDVYVAAADLEKAREVVESVERGEIIGDQWQPTEAAEGSAGQAAGQEMSEPARPAPGEFAEPFAPRAEGTTLRLVLLVAVAIGLVVAGVRC